MLRSLSILGRFLKEDLMRVSESYYVGITVQFFQYSLQCCGHNFVISKLYPHLLFKTSRPGDSKSLLRSSNILEFESPPINDPM